MEEIDDTNHVNISDSEDSENIIEAFDNELDDNY